MRPLVLLTVLTLVLVPTTLFAGTGCIGPANVYTQAQPAVGWVAPQTVTVQKQVPVTNEEEYTVKVQDPPTYHEETRTRQVISYQQEEVEVQACPQVAAAPVCACGPTCTCVQQTAQTVTVRRPFAERRLARKTRQLARVAERTQQKTVTVMDTKACNCQATVVQAATVAQPCCQPVSTPLTATVQGL